MRFPVTRDALLDGLATLVVVAIASWNAWSSPAIFGTHIAGPKWVTGAMPLLLGLPLLWRRRIPLLAVAVITLAFVAQALASGDSAEGVEILIAWALALYAVAAFATRRRAFAGLAFIRCRLHALRLGGSQRPRRGE